MSGFSGIIGFVFTFIVLMAVFISIYFVFISQIATTQDLFGDNLDKTVKTLREDYSVDKIYLSSGRLQLDINNYGKENFYYGYGGESCFDYFIDSDFKSKKNVEFKPDFSLIGNYYFIESGDTGLIFMNYNSMNFGLETVKLISCNGNEFEFVVDSLVLDWMDNDYSFRTNLSTDVDVIDRENYIIDYTLTSSEYNNTYYDNLEYVVFCAAANFELLNLPFDNFSLTPKDYGLKNYDVVSGYVISDDYADPTVSNGIILKGMNFDVGDKISINNFDFVNESAKTISFWFKSDSVLTSIDSKKDLFKFGNEYYIGFNHENSGKIGFYRYNSSNDITFNLKSSNSIWDADTWYNIILVLDSSTTHKMFLNGELENSFSTILVGDSTLGLVVGNIQ